MQGDLFRPYTLSEATEGNPSAFPMGHDTLPSPEEEMPIQSNLSGQLGRIDWAKCYKADWDHQTGCWIYYPRSLEPKRHKFNL